MSFLYTHLLGVTKLFEPGASAHHKSLVFLCFWKNQAEIDKLIQNQLEKEEILAEKQAVEKSFPRQHLSREPGYRAHYVPNITCYLATVSLFGSFWSFELSEVRNWAC